MMHVSESLLSDIVLVDIIGFSKLSLERQLEIISYISKSYKKLINKMLANSDLTLEAFLSGIIPTGDGFFCVLNPAYKGFGAILALSFSHLSDLIAHKYPYFKGIRIAVHSGEVNRFTDILGQDNYVGYGLNECQRYISSQEDHPGTVIISDKAYSALEGFLIRHRDFHRLLLLREFKYSTPFIFTDKHHYQYTGYLIWMRQGGIINPPSLTST
jgi:hypothetical protein